MFLLRSLRLRLSRLPIGKRQNLLILLHLWLYLVVCLLAGVHYFNLVWAAVLHP